MTWLLCKKTKPIVDGDLYYIAQAVIDGDIVEMHDFDRWADGDFREDIFKVETVNFDMSEILIKVTELTPEEELDG